jgi:hypothetical protein
MRSVPPDEPALQQHKLLLQQALHSIDARIL